MTPHRIQLQSASSDALTVRYGLGEYVRGLALEADGPAGTVRTVTGEYNAAGRLTVTGLAPDTAYMLTVRLGDRVLERFSARTLPAWDAAGRLFRLAVLGDPHLTVTRADRNGRLHEESAAILRATLDDVKARGCELLFITGDLTDAGTREEYALAQSILSGFPGPRFAVPGNHDAVEGRIANWRRWEMPETFLTEVRGVQIAGIDTGEARLNTPANRRIVAAVDPERPVLALSHYQFFADRRIGDADRVPEDLAEAAGLTRQIAAWRGVAYIGHKNIATAVRTGAMLHINTPQTLHYPAGWLEVEVFRHGVRQTFRPLFSEALHEYSRLGTARVIRDGGETFDRFRDAAAPGVWNMAYDWETRTLCPAQSIPPDALTVLS